MYLYTRTKDFYDSYNVPYSKGTWLQNKFKEFKNNRNKIYSLGKNLEKKYYSKKDWNSKEKKFYEGSINYINSLVLYDEKKKSYQKGISIAMTKLFRKDYDYAKGLLPGLRKRINDSKTPEEQRYYQGFKDTVYYHLYTLDKLKELGPSPKKGMKKFEINEYKNLYNNIYKNRKNLNSLRPYFNIDYKYQFKYDKY